MIPELQFINGFSGNNFSTDLNIHNNTSYEHIYEQIFQNIDNIIFKYENILNPKINNTTQTYLNNGYDYKHSCALSFTITLLLYFQMNNAFIY